DRVKLVIVSLTGADRPGPHGVADGFRETVALVREHEVLDAQVSGGPGDDDGRIERDAGSHARVQRRGGAGVRAVVEAERRVDRDVGAELVRYEARMRHGGLRAAELADPVCRIATEIHERT